MIDAPWPCTNSSFILLLGVIVTELVKHMPVLPLAVASVWTIDIGSWRALAFHIQHAMSGMDSRRYRRSASVKPVRGEVMKTSAYVQSAI